MCRVPLQRLHLQHSVLMPTAFDPSALKTTSIHRRCRSHAAAVAAMMSLLLWRHCIVHCVRLTQLYISVASVLWHCWLWHQEEHLACEKFEWWGVCVVICLERSADCLHMVQLMPLHPETPSSIASFQSRLVLPFWHRLTQIVLEKRPLNGCSSVHLYRLDLRL